MTQDKTPSPTDAEIDLLISKHWPAFATVGAIPLRALRNAFREGISEWGSPVVAGELQPSAEGPPEVWLQLHCDCLPHERLEPVDYTGGDVTWCWHAIHSDDVRYVRADLTPQPTHAQAGAVPWGACIGDRVFVGELPEHARKVATAEGLPIRWLYTSPGPRSEAELIQQMVDALESCDPGDWSTGHVIYPSYDEGAVSAAIELGRARLKEIAP